MTRFRRFGSLFGVLSVLLTLALIASADYCWGP